MELFSERQGYTKPREALQIDEIDDELKNRLWNIQYMMLKAFSMHPFFNYFTEKLWEDFLGEPIDKIKKTASVNYWSTDYNKKYVYEYVRGWFFNADWYKLYDIIEFSLQEHYNFYNYSDDPALRYHEDEIATDFRKKIDKALVKGGSGYKLFRFKFVPLVSEIEIEGLEQVLENTEQIALKSVNTHLKTALNKLSDKANPDYRNSIKESISAVEALVNIINGTKNDTLGKALKKLKQKTPIHASLEKGFGNIYGYTSDGDGIRHAMMEESTCDFDDAKFMLLSCSAFVNYLIGKANKAGILSNG